MVARSRPLGGRAGACRSLCGWCWRVRGCVPPVACRIRRASAQIPTGLPRAVPRDMHHKHHHHHEAQTAPRPFRLLTIALPRFQELGFAWSRTTFTKPATRRALIAFIQKYNITVVNQHA